MRHKRAAVIFSLLFLLAGMVGNLNSQTPPSVAASPAKAGDVKGDDLPAKYVELWNTGDPALAKRFDSFVMHSHGVRLFVDPTKLQRVVDSWRKAMPDLKFEIADTIAQPDKVVLRLNFTGTYKQRLFPNTLDPSFFTPVRTIRSTEILIFALKDGKVREIWEEYDEDAMRNQMGGVWRTNEELDGKAMREKAQQQNAGAKP